MNSASGFKEAEVVVAGGGPGGACAAIAAARTGAKVLLVEQLGFPGGMFTGGNMCVANCWPWAGLGEEIFGRLKEMGAAISHPDDPPNSPVFHFGSYAWRNCPFSGYSTQDPGWDTAIAQAMANGDLPHSTGRTRDMVPYWGHPRPELAHLWWEDGALLWGGTVEGVDGTDADSLTHAEVECRKHRCAVSGRTLEPPRRLSACPVQAGQGRLQRRGFFL